MYPDASLNIQPEDMPAPPDLQDSVDLYRTLARDGKLLLEHPQEERQFHALLSALGKVLMITPVKIMRRDDAPTIFSFRRMRAHTDTPAADYIGWYCVRPGLEGEATLVVDTQPVVETLGTEVLKVLAEVRCRVPDREKAPTRLHLAYEDHCLVEFVGGRARLNYTPYLDFETNTQEKRDALGVFETALARLVEEPEAISLKTGQALIVDNRRFLHWRTDLAPDSPRCLYRYLVSAAK